MLCMTLEDNDGVQEILEYIGETLTCMALTAVEDAGERRQRGRIPQPEIATPDQMRPCQVQDTGRLDSERSALPGLPERQTPRRSFTATTPQTCSYSVTVLEN